MLVSRETGAPTVRRQEWSSDQEGLQQHAQLETTHWSAPTQSYGKMVAGVAVRSGGHAVHARRQVEVMSARAPGSLRVLRATVTTSHSSSSTSTQGHRTFDDLKMLVNPLDISSQRDRSSIGRSGALGARRPPSRIRPTSTLAAQVTREAREGLERLTSPSIVANGISKLSNSSSVDIVEVRSDSDKRSNNSDEKRDSGTKYKVNYPDNESEESFYDSCPEKDSIFKDESEQLEEWRRSSKIRRSLQFPRRSPSQGKCLDLPDNWGSVSRIKRELESVQNNALFPKTLFHNPSLFGPSENSVIREEETESINTESMDTSFSDTFLVKPSTLKTKSFISLETLNEVRGRLKNHSTEVEGDSRVLPPPAERDDGIEAEINPPKAEDNSPAEPKVTRVRSYVFGMEAMLNAQNEKKQNYPGGSNSLESRVSKISSASSNRNDDWYMRRKSYGFEKVANKSENNSLTSHDKNNIESSTDSGICQSSELVNSLSNGVNNRSTVVTLGQSEKRETFEDWLQKNRKSFASNKYKCVQDEEVKEGSNQRDYNRPDTQYPDILSVHVPVKPDDSMAGNNNKQLFFRKLSEGTTLSVESSAVENSTKAEATAPFAFKRHTIAVDGIKEIRDLYEPKNSVTKTFFSTANSGLKIEENSEDSIEKKSKKVEFCKTEVHFTAESGRVNIVESDGKPPSTNNFRRRRRNSGAAAAAVKEDKNNKLPVTRFGDSIEDNKVLGIEDPTAISSEKMKLNYAVITEIKSTAKDSPKLAEKKECPSIVQINGDLSEGDQPRGILKNKPIKPRPYLLGEDPEPPTESEAAEQNLWGVKLRPVKRTEEPSIWKSSVLLNNDSTDDIPNDCVIKSLGHGENSLKSNKETCMMTSVSEVSKVNKGLLSSCNKINLGNGTPNVEAKGYSTKVNFGNGGDAVIETSFRQSENKHDFVKSEGYKEIFDNGRNLNGRPDRTHASTLASQQNVQKNHIITEKKQIFDKSVTNLNSAKKEMSPNIKKDSAQAAEDRNQTTFADSISTPRSLMPARGSARKLKQHELSYFGVTDSHSRETSATKINTFESKDKNIKISNTSATNTSYSKSNYTVPLNTSSEGRKYEPRTESPIYENLVINNTNTELKPTKVKHPGESIIEELTKAADEILQALNGYSDEESSHVSSGDDGDPKNRNKKRSIKPLETISETFTHRAKTVETKAVQADYGTRERNRSQLATNKKVGSKNSSNSSIESIVRDSKNSTHRVKSKVVENVAPEKPQRKKVSSVEAVKARRLHRANSRDALYQIHGSSSEDLPGNMVDVVKKKTSRRSKYGDVKSNSNTSINIHSSSTVIDENKDNKYSSRTLSTVLPEIRHKTAVSTIKAVERNGTKDKTSSRTKSSTKERSRRREKLQEGTISSLNRVRVLHREKSRSADTSLDRETGHQRERVRAKDTASYHGDESYDPIKVRHSSSRVTSQTKTHKEESHDKVKPKESSSIHRTLRSDKDGSHEKIRVRDPSDHGHRTHEKTRVRDTSSHRRDRSHDKAAKELVPHHGERYDERARAKEHSSHHRDRDRSKDKRRERESSTLHRDRSQDSARLRTPEIAKKKTLSSGSSNLGLIKVYDNAPLLRS